MSPSAIVCTVALCTLVATTFASSAVDRSLSLVQLSAQARSQLQGERPPSTDVVDMHRLEAQLEAVNESLARVNETVVYVNETAADLFDKVSVVTDACAALIPELEACVAAVKVLPGGEHVVDWAETFLNTANETRRKYEAKVGDIPSVVHNALAKVMPALTVQAQLVVQEFMDAARQVRALQTEAANATGAVAREGSGVVAKEGSEKLGKTPGCHGQHQSIGTRVPMAHQEEDCSEAALLQVSSAHDALNWHAVGAQTDNAVATNVERAVLAKGASSKCAKAAAAVSKANSSVAELLKQIDSLNETVDAVLLQDLGVSTSGLEALKAEVSTALHPATANIPKQLREPIMQGISVVTSIGADLNSSLAEVLPSIEKQVKYAREPAVTLMQTASELQDATRAACSKNAS